MKYDGIWACASILHLPKNELKSVFAKMIRAVKPGRADEKWLNLIMKKLT